MSDIPETHYAKCGDIFINYLVAGDGPIDLLFTSGFVISAESFWEHPVPARFVRRLASFSRLIMFDRRGTGHSDPTAPDDPPTLEQWADDAIAVLDDVGSERPTVFGWANIGGPAAILFAATHPERISSLVLANTYAKGSKGDGYPWGVDDTPEDRERRYERVLTLWGQRGFIPDADDFDDDELEWVLRAYRHGASPTTALSILQISARTDVRSVLGSIGAPTLVVHHTNERLALERGRHLADNIPGARFVDLGKGPLYLWRGDSDRLLDEVQEFVTGARPEPAPDRVLATVLFSDIVASTERVVEIGDHRWKDLLGSHDDMVRQQLERFRGREIKHTGDGFLATFDGPARAVRCARAIGEAASPLGVEVRAGLHTGEIELRGGDVTGIGVHIARRVCDAASPSQVLVSRTVTDLVAGSGLEFEDRGSHELKGVPGMWQLFAVKP